MPNAHLVDQVKKLPYMFSRIVLVRDLFGSLFLTFTLTSLLDWPKFLLCYQEHINQVMAFALQWLIMADMIG